MKYRKLGNTGFDVSEIGFGTWQIGGKRWQSPEKDEAISLLREAKLAGINIFDVAVVYGQYRDEMGCLQSKSQELLGEAFKLERKEVIYCLKLGQFDEYTHRSDYNPERVIEQFKQSLKRLKTDYVDIVLIHAPPLMKVRDEKAITVLKTLRALGDVKAIGYSFENEPQHVQEALKQDIDVIMFQYNLLDTDCGSVIQDAKEHGIGVLVGGPFKRGYLTGRWKTLADIKKEEDNYWEWNLRYNKDKVAQILERVNHHLDEAGSPKELRKRSLDFILSRPVSSAIVGHRSVNEVIENTVLTK